MDTMIKLGRSELREEIIYFVLEVQVPDYLTNIILPDQSTGLWDGFDVCVPTTALNRLPFNVYAAMDCYSPRLAILSLSVLAHNEYLPIVRSNSFATIPWS